MSYVRIEYVRDTLSARAATETDPEAPRARMEGVAGPRQPRLVLHFDVNETIMVGDPAAGVGFEQCLNRIIAKSAVVKPSAEGGHTWHDGSPLDLASRHSGSEPPALLPVWELPQGCLFFTDWSLPSEIRGFANSFTADGSPGAIYRPLFNQLEESLRCSSETATDPRLCHDGIHHFLLPAFFHTLTALRYQRREVSIVIRTFGTDAPAVAEAMAAFAEGGYLGAKPWPELAAALSATGHWVGRYRALDGAFTLTGWTKHAKGAPDLSVFGSDRKAKQVAEQQFETKQREAAGGRDVDNEHFVDAELSGHPRVGSVSCTIIQDDYHWWCEKSYLPAAGKPLYLTADVAGVSEHPIFFDDNIHPKPDDSIVAVRVRRDESQPFAALTGVPTDPFPALQPPMCTTASLLPAALFLLECSCMRALCNPM
eukprot:COSAG02_NODE_8168_length_2680_cov_1.244091_1_plen_426_part_00